MKNSAGFKKSFFYIVLLIISACLLINNAFYGFGWTDEALYTAMAGSLYHGKRLFFDIFEPTQMYSVLVLPLFSFFVKLTGSTDGIYLFMRIITVIIQLLAATLLFLIFSKKYRKEESFFASLVLIIFSRAQLFGPSYYTLVLVNFTIANILLFYVFELKAKSFWLFISGIFYGFAILCNPYIVLPYVIFSLCAVIFPVLRKDIKKYAFVWAGTVFTGAAFLAFVFKDGNIEDFPAALNYFFSSPEYSSKTMLLRVKWLLKFPRLFVTQFVYFLPFTVLAVTVFFNKNLKEKFNASGKTKRVLLILLILNYMLEIVLTESDNGKPVTGFFVLSILSFILFSRKTVKDYKKEVIFFLIPGLSLSFMQCLASDTGFGVFSIGIAACMPFSARLYFDTFHEKLNAVSLKILFILPLCLFILGTFYYRVNLTYRDYPISSHYIFVPQFEKHIAKIDCGPAKGLWTETKNKLQYDSIYSAVKNIKAEKGGSFMVLKLCPWAYLVNEDLEPFSMTAWRVSADDARLKPYFEEFFHFFPEHILFLYKSIRDNGNNYIDEDSYLKKEMEKRNYKTTYVECGVLWEKR